jgi:hypothetical protein
MIIGVVARISGCQNQKELSLDDQVDHAKQVIAEFYDGPAEYRVIATKGKGERLDRPELAEIEAMLRTRELDLLVAEDIGRMVRGGDAARLCGVAVDHGTRVLAPNDCIDTADGSWEEDVISACRDHVGHNAHTSKRIKQKKMNRFKKFGGATPCEIYGYVKPPGAKTYDDWIRVESAGEVYAEWFRRLRETRNCSAVAEWLNGLGVPTGRYARRRTWDGAMVRRITANPLLKGMPGRGFKHTVKHHETGRRVSVRNPDGPVYREYPNLAHVDGMTFDEVNAILDAANARMGRKPVNGTDPRWQVPRKRTRFPGQHALCWYCGREYLWGGNGQIEFLMCGGSKSWRCWNSMSFDGALAAEKVADAIGSELCRLEGFDSQFRDLVEWANRAGGAGLDRALAELDKAERDQAREEANLGQALAAYGPRPFLEAKMADLEQSGRALARRRLELTARSRRAPRLPGSVAELRRLFEEKSRGLARDSPEFGAMLRPLVPEFHVHLVRLCEGGHPLPRARVRLDLGGFVSDAFMVPEFGAMLSRELTLDLFIPPQRERIREEAARLRAAGLTQREIGRRLAEPATQAAVCDALALDRLMRERGLAGPYVFVDGPPEDYPKLRRHRNPKYRFEPLEGYPRPRP